MGVFEIEEKAGCGEAKNDAYESPSKEIVVRVEIVEEEAIGNVKGGNEKESGNDFGADNKEKAEIGGFFK